MMTVLASSTELDAVNELLMRVSEAPVNNLTTLPRVGTAALLAIRNTSRNFQSTDSPHFNTIEELDIAIDGNGYIQLPTNTLFVDSPDGDYIYREGKLYDRENKTDVFTETVEVDLTVFLQWDELPGYCKRYFTALAKRTFIAGRSGHQWTGSDEAEMIIAKAAYMSAEIDSADYNILTDSLSISTITRRSR